MVVGLATVVADSLLVGPFALAAGLVDDDRLVAVTPAIELSD